MIYVFVSNVSRSDLFQFWKRGRNGTNVWDMKMRLIPLTIYTNASEYVFTNYNAVSIKFLLCGTERWTHCVGPGWCRDGVWLQTFKKESKITSLSIPQRVLVRGFALESIGRHRRFVTNCQPMGLPGHGRIHGVLLRCKGGKNKCLKKFKKTWNWSCR